MMTGLMMVVVVVERKTTRATHFAGIGGTFPREMAMTSCWRELPVNGCFSEHISNRRIPRDHMSDLLLYRCPLQISGER